MTEDHKKKLCELAGGWICDSSRCVFYNGDMIGCRDCLTRHDRVKSDTEITLEILIKAMWTINRKKIWKVRIGSTMTVAYVAYGRDELLITCKYKDMTEQKALEAALIYVLDNSEGI